MVLSSGGMKFFFFAKDVCCQANDSMICIAGKGILNTITIHWPFYWSALIIIINLTGNRILQRSVIKLNIILIMPPFEEEGYIVLLMLVGRLVGRPGGFCWLSWKPYYITKSLYFTCRLVITSRWPLLILGSLGQSHSDHEC